ncbi:hypothetical protein [Bifidobacterium sp. ESL0704]|uniref:hypothetical protein n=1 Tax=Bifidobacterium sp. ESL0704 TaxID=2983219 RepID=UPI0023FA18E7|nr:hypothetical protein [Bifidobacterium sp. ESL0704]WEV52381.1 hypothetical protein OZX64_05610 [Bifidobacterium sp. ESL0704]
MKRNDDQRRFIDEGVAQLPLDSDGTEETNRVGRANGTGKTASNPRKPSTDVVNASSASGWATESDSAAVDKRAIKTSPQDGEMNKKADKLQILVTVVVIIVIVLASAVGFGMRGRAQRAQQMIEMFKKDMSTHEPPTVDKVSDQVSRLRSDRSAIDKQVQDMIRSKNVGEADTAKLNSLVSDTDADSATFAGLDGMDTVEVKMQLDRYSKAYADYKALLVDYINHAPAISAMYKTCGGNWGSISGSAKDKAKYDQTMASCRSTVTPLSDSNDTAMKTLVASVNAALDASDKAAKQIVPIDENADDITAQIDRMDDLEADADPSFGIREYVEQYGRDLRAERDAFHLQWCVDRAYKTERAQEKSAKEGTKARKAYLKGPGTADSAKNPETTAKALGDVARQWNLLDATVDALNVEGMKSLEPVDLDDLSAVIKAADTANEALSKQMDTDGEKNDEAYTGYQSSYRKDRALITTYATTILAVSNSEAACINLPEQTSLDAEYTQFSSYVDACSTALKPLKNAKDKKTHDLYAKMSANAAKNVKIVARLKALGAPSDAANGPHGHEYQQLRAQLIKNTDFKHMETFDNYIDDFDHARDAVDVLDALYRLSGQSEDD